ncbi:MAG: alpha/beta fold hydrolase [Bacteroidota bacterium]|nr:alpha/beta fold hydrolase [Bacteroidota bacterium]
MKLSQRFALKLIRAKFKLLSAISKKKAAQQAFRLFCTPPTRDKKELAPIFVEAEELRFRLALYDVVGYRWNKGGRGKVLILHGFESTAINFAAYIQPLIQKGYEVLAFDAPAHGRSSGKRITTLIYRDLIKYIQEQYGPLQSYMGHSLGGFALCLALFEIPHDENSRVALIAPASETSTAIDNFFDFLRLDDKVRKEFENLITVISGHPVSWFSISRTMKNIRAKILWVHDETDAVTPLRDALKVKAENYSNVQFVITKGLGHSRIYRDTEVIRIVTDFL